MKTMASFLMAFVLVFCGTVPGFAGDTIKVGLVDTYTGPATTFTNDVLDGFRLATERINAKGGVLGKKIEHVTRDDKFKPDIGLTMAKELILKENVDILMGTINSATALAVSDLCKKEKVPFLVTFSKSDKITGEKGHRYVFSLNENTEMAGRAAAKALAAKPYVKYWIAGDDYEYGHAIANGVFDHLKSLNPKVQLLGQSWWKVGETDFTPYITQILAAKPDFVIVATGGAGMVNFQKAAQSTGFNKRVPFYQHTAIELSTLLPQGPNVPEGVQPVSQERRPLRVHGRAVHREVVREGGEGRPGEVHRRDGGDVARQPRGKAGNARVRPPAPAPDVLRRDEEVGAVRFPRRGGRRSGPAEGFHARVRGDQE